MEQRKRKKFIKKLKNKYRLVILNDETLHESASITLTPINVFITFSSLLVIYGGIVVCLLLFSPLKVYLPERTNSTFRREEKLLERKLDSVINVNNIYERRMKALELMLTDGQVDSLLSVSDTGKK